MVGTGRAASLGILFKGGEALQRAGDVTHVVLDKTGTLTEGRPVVVEALVLDPDEARVLAAVAAVEALSEHPLAAAIVDHVRSRGIPPAAALGFAATPGRGATASVTGAPVVVGSAAFLAEHGIATAAFGQPAERLAGAGRTLVYAAIGGRAAALFAIGDPLRAEAAQAVRQLRALGLEVVLLTGDARPTAEAVAGALGIARVRAEVLPQAKADEIARLQAEGAFVLMAGDGINDAPALARADVGVALGSGTDVAVEAADVALLRADLRGLPAAIALSRRAMRTMRQNLFWAFAYNAVGIPVAAGILYPGFGILLSPILASAAMALSSVSVVTNSLRLRGARLELAA
jgi:Cu+-exporting ATPase